MTEFVTEVLKISRDGVLNINEMILMAIAAIIVLLFLATLKKPVMRWLDSVTPGRKKTIFSHRKNPYKNRIGKKSKASKKRK